MDRDYKDICKELKNVLDAKRYTHTLGVAYTSACLAMSKGVDMEKAYLAGLLHDCAKYMTDKEFIDYCKKHDIEMTDVEKANPALLHAKAGAYIAKEKYGVTDTDILSAIRYHTTGHPGMSDMEAIVFTADYIEPGRNHDPELPVIRQEAFDCLDKAICHIYSNTMNHLKKSDKTLDPTTSEAFEYYKALIKK